MEKTATPQAKPKNKHFWNFQPASGDNPPELILYGDIASETWWGDEVTPRAVHGGTGRAGRCA